MTRKLTAWSMRILACFVGLTMVWQILFGEYDNTSRALTAPATPQATSAAPGIDVLTQDPPATVQLAAAAPIDNDAGAPAANTRDADTSDKLPPANTPARQDVANNQLPTPGNALRNLTNRDAQWSANATPSANDQRIEITSATNIKIRFQGYNDLTGDYRIGPDNSISIPVLGRLNVSGMISDDLERQLSRRVLNITGREAHVTVEVNEYKPVLINGQVSRPGANPWTPGMTVLHAETLAGGVYRPGERSGGISPVDTQLARARRMTSELQQVLATLARLRAERAGKNEITMTDQLIQVAGRAQAEALIKAQTSALISRNNSTESQLKTLEQAIKLSYREVAAMEEQTKRIERQIEVRSDLLSKLGSLRKNGHILNDRYLTEQARLAELEERRANVSVALARVRSDQIKYRRDVIKLRLDRRAELDTSILALEREAAELDIELQDARKAYGKLSGNTMVSMQDKDQKYIISYVIVRKTGPKIQRIPAQPNTQLLPGDLVMVSNSAELVR